MTKRVHLWVAVFCLLLGARTAGAEDLKLGKLAKVYAGSEGEELTVVHLDGGKRALIRFRGVDGDFEGKVFVHDVDDLGERGVDYRMKNKGQDYVSVTVRAIWGGERSWEIYVPGRRDTIRVRFHEAKSHATKPEQVLAEYQQQQRGATAPATAPGKPAAPPAKN